MEKGRKICDTLKQIRLKIARENDIQYAPEPCNHKGDCKGTCPACEEEVRMLERQIRHRRMTAGKVALAAGLSLGLGAMALESCSTTTKGKIERSPATINNGGSEHQLMGDVVASDIEYESPVPQFPGGDEAMQRFFEENMRQPESEMAGRVVVRFYVDSDGKVSDPEIVRHLSPAHDEEALRLVGMLPDFKPACIDGKICRAPYTVVVPFGKKD